MQNGTDDHDLGEMRETYERLADGIRDFRDELAAMRVTADSADGLVSATVSGRGELVELHIDPRVFRAPDSRRLAEQIVGTIRFAAGCARQDVFELAKPFLPPDAEIDRTDVDFDPALHQLDRALGRIPPSR
ncbi:Conserved DNA-binding protein YbaB [Saccharopolyspora shandongensis]|uniref:Conserved DNA-binding protein YbaB n=1 Tax=Saccharopolyspora shandongensis TaxID=418495 RepID=A0A1H3TVP1_9PSEU|nr:YbaB/EbfC family nucleoid-associated protein [Saccharopolyspora shandongensis]SDZ54172.1 Conserved DNA-binding protein YbaB [Saccharopolyspora shandongensis]